MERNFVFPFAAVEGQDSVKKALLWNAVNPLIGGVLISGEKGTAKSTLVRGLAALLPGMKVVELPLNVTEDRLVGTMDMEKAVKEGKKAFEPGILQKAHGNILYVDEVNLLSENIVNCLLEVSASGVNKVEREGISCSHPACFILVGTMNPEEGMLRPQFIDRFGLYVEVKGLEDLNLRVDVIKRRLEYERDPAAYTEKWRGKAAEVTEKILLARDKMVLVQVNANAMKLAVQIAEQGNCAGHRAELAVVETAKAIAAICGRTYLTIDDIKMAAKFALPHRVREKSPASACPPGQQPQDDDTAKQEKETDSLDEGRAQTHSEQREERSQGQNMDGGGTSAAQDSDPDSDENNSKESADTAENDEKIEEPGDIFTVKPLEIKPADKRKRRGSGKRSKTVTGSGQGRYIKYTLPKGKLRDIAFDATFRAAAPFQRERKKGCVALAIRDSDIREKVRERRTGSTILFIVDASGSMGANRRMKAVKGAVLSLLNDVYQQRDKVGMLAFRKDAAELLLGVTGSVDLAQKKLRDLPTGGKTPLAAGLYMGYELIKVVMLKDSDTIPFIVVVSDGRANVSLRGGDPVKDALHAARKIAAEGIKSLFIDTELEHFKLGLGLKIAEVMKADYQKLDELEASRITCSVKDLVK